jgi:hypothetical protein
MKKIGQTELDLDARKRRNELFTSPLKEVSVASRPSPIRPSPIPVAPSQQDLYASQDGQLFEETKRSRCELLRLYSEKKDEIREKREMLEELTRRRQELEATAAKF